jgi:hypothetical protein
MGLRRGTYTETKILQNGVAAPTTAVGETFPLSMEGSEAAVDGVNGAWDSIAVQITGITTATVTFQATIDGTNWVAIGLVDSADWTSIATTATADGIYVLHYPKGFTKFRANITSNTAGTIYVTVQGA